MPLYEYRCGACGAVFEVIQKFSDTPLTVHEGCGGPLEKVITAAALQFKGTGWYVTDYARKKNGFSNGSSKSESHDSKSAAKTDSSAAKEKPKSDSGKSDSGKSSSTS